MSTVTVNFSKTSDDPIVLNKTYSPIKSKDLNFRDLVDVLYPRIIIQYDADLLDCNYAEIPMFNRFYFVKVKLLTSNSMSLEFNVDVLMSRKNEIAALPSIIIRTGALSKPTYTPDETLPIDPNRIGDIETPIYFTSPHGDNTKLESHIVLHTI